MSQSELNCINSNYFDFSGIVSKLSKQEASIIYSIFF